MAPMADTVSSLIFRLSVPLREDNMVFIKVGRYGSISAPVLQEIQGGKKIIIIMIIIDLFFNYSPHSADAAFVQMSVSCRTSMNAFTGGSSRY